MKEGRILAKNQWVIQLRQEKVRVRASKSLRKNKKHANQGKSRYYNKGQVTKY